MIKSLDELQRFKRQEEKALIRQTESQRARILVGMGTCGIAAGAQEVLDAILDELKKRDIKDVTVTQTGCIGLCAREPLAEVIVPGQKKVLYGDIDADKARQIVAHHVVKGVIIKQWAVNEGEV